MKKISKNAGLKILIGYPPLLSKKGTALLSQNRQFQFFNNPTFLFPVELGTGATMLKEKGFKVIWKDAIAEGPWFHAEKYPIV